MIDATTRSAEAVSIGAALAAEAEWKRRNETPSLFDAEGD